MFEPHYIDEGTGIPLVFQHGLGGNLNQARELMGGLEEIRLIAMDSRGHGESPIGEGLPPSFETYAADIIALLDHLGIDEAVLGGISMGSGIAVRAALHHPERVKGLLLVRPAWLAAPRPESLEVLWELADYVEQENGKADFQQTERFQALRASSPGAATSVLGQFDRPQGEHTAQILRRMINDEPFFDREDLSYLKHPALVLASEDDPLHPFSFGEEIANPLANGELTAVPSKYVAAEQHREEVRKAAMAFLAQFRS